MQEPKPNYDLIFRGVHQIAVPVEELWEFVNKTQDAKNLPRITLDDMCSPNSNKQVWIARQIGNGEFVRQMGRQDHDKEAAQHQALERIMIELILLIFLFYLVV